MRPQKIDDQTLLSGLMEVLTSKGYDGASLNDLAASSGLKKASLYHRFPGGKKEIVLAVLNFVTQWIHKNIVSVLTESELPPKLRLEKALKSIREVYQDGKSTCLLRALSLDNGITLFGDELFNAAEEWVSSFRQLGKDVGMDDETAKRTAIDVLTKIQGSLVVSKMLKDTSVFNAAMLEIEKSYMPA